MGAVATIAVVPLAAFTLQGPRCCCQNAEENETNLEIQRENVATYKSKKVHKPKHKQSLDTIQEEKYEDTAALSISTTELIPTIDMSPMESESLDIHDIGLDTADSDSSESSLETKEFRSTIELKKELDADHHEINGMIQQYNALTAEHDQLSILYEAECKEKDTLIRKLEV